MIRHLRDGTANGEMCLVMDWKLLGADIVCKGKAGIWSNGPHAGEIFALLLPQRHLAMSTDIFDC